MRCRFPVSSLVLALFGPLIWIFSYQYWQFLRLWVRRNAAVTDGRGIDGFYRIVFCLKNSKNCFLILHMKIKDQMSKTQKRKLHVWFQKMTTNSRVLVAVKVQERKFTRMKCCSRSIAKNLFHSKVNNTKILSSTKTFWK